MLCAGPSLRSDLDFDMCGSVSAPEADMLLSEKRQEKKIVYIRTI